MSNESHDSFLGGKFHAFQPNSGFRAGTDTIFLSAAVPAKPGDHILELGAGSGVGLLALHSRVTDLKLIGIELLQENVERANRNFRDQNVDGRVYCGDIFDCDLEVFKEQFDIVTMNPPFYSDGDHFAPDDYNRSTAHMMAQTIGDWTQIALKRVRPKGSLAMIYPSDNLDKIIKNIPEGNSIEILPLLNENDRLIRRVIVKITKQSKNPLKLHRALILHNQNGERTQANINIAQHGKAIEW